MIKNITAYFQKIRGHFREKTIFGIEAFDLLSKLGLGFILVIMIVSIMPRERPFEYGNLTVGSIAQEEIIAPFTFPIIKSDVELKEQRQAARLSVPPVFVKLDESENIQAIKLSNLLNELSLTFESVSTKPTSVSSKNNFKRDTLNSDSLLAQISLKYNINLNENDLKLLLKLYQTDVYDDFKLNLTTGFEKIYEQGIIGISKSRIEESEITLIKNGVEEEIEQG